MRNTFSNNPAVWSLMIVLTLCGWQQSNAQQSTRSIGYRSTISRTQDEVPPQDPAAQQLENLPLPPAVEEPEVYVEDRFVGWQGVGTGTGTNRLTDELRANWVMVNDNGLLAGQVLGLKGSADSEEGKTPEPEPVVGDDPTVVEGEPTPDQSAPAQTGMNVYLLNRGRLLGTAKLDPQNRFEFQGVKPGSYALVGYGPSGFFAFGFNVMPYVENATQPRELYIPAIATSGKTVTDWVAANAPNVHFRPFGKQRFGEGIDDPPRLYGITGLRTFSPQATAATSIVSHPAGISDDGRLVGRVHHINSLDGRPMDLRTTNVQLVQEGKVLKQIGSDNFGVFEFSDVAPGSYELRASGPDGLGAIQIEVVAADDPQGKPIDFALVSPETIGWLNHFAHESAYFAAISGPRTDDRCNRCGQRCSQCGGCRCQDNCCRCEHGCNSGYGGGYGGYGGYGGGYGGYGQGGYGYGSSGYGGYGYGGYGGYGPGW